MASINNGKLYIKKRSFPEWLVLIVFLTPFIMAFFTEFLRLPGIIKFLPDLSLFIITIMFFVRAKKNKNIDVSRRLLPFVFIVVGFFIYTLTVYIFNFDSIFYYIWGVRNNFRFYIAFFAFAYFLTEDFVDVFLKFLDIAFWIHVIVTLFQYFVLGYIQDNLGGIFGVTKGCNGYVVLFLCIVMIKSTLSFMNGTESALGCFTKCGAALMVSAFAELKSMFFFYIVILILSAIMTAFSVKKVILIFVASLLLFLSYTVLISLFENFDEFLSLDSLLNVLSSESYSGDDTMNRLFSIVTISRLFLVSFPQQLFGMGLGNCDVSTFDIFTTDFYTQNVDTLYSGFSIAFLFLETGYIGMLFYLSFFVAIFIYAFKLKRNKLGNLLYNQMAMIMSIMCLMLFVYNSSLRLESGYLAFFVLALPFVGIKLSGNKETQELFE